MDPGQMGGAVIGWRRACHQQRAHGELRGTATAGKFGFQPGGHGGVVADDGFQPARRHRLVQPDAPSSAMARPAMAG